MHEIKLTLKPDQAAALQHLLRRITFADIGDRTPDIDQKYAAYTAIEAIQRQLIKCSN